MKIYLSFDTEHLGDVFCDIEWKLPFLPRAGEELIIPKTIKDNNRFNDEYKQLYIKYKQSTYTGLDQDEDISDGISQYLMGYNRVSYVYYSEDDNGTIIPNLMLCSEAQYNADLIDKLREE